MPDVLRPDVPPPPATPAGPIPTAERVQTIDILRGLALLGIIAANMRGFAGPAAAYMATSIMWPLPADLLAQAAVDVFVQGKFITIFSLLFGVGFAVQASRAAARGGRFAGLYTRRLLVLAAIGLAHGLLIWWGDILLPYAAIGFLLFFFRTRKDKTILVWAIIAYVTPLVMVTGIVAVQAIAGPIFSMPPAPTPESLQEVVRIYRDESWAAITAQRAREAVGHNWGYFGFFIPNLLGVFLFGLLAWRRRLFEPSEGALAGYRKVMWYGLTIGVLGNAAAVTLRWALQVDPMVLTPATLAMFVVQQVAVPALSAGYVSAVILLARSARWQPRLAPFAAVGRTALSNYLFQSVAGTLLFYSYGLGFYGRFGPAAFLIPTVAIYSLETVLSGWWLARFRFGPVEWLWRSATYGAWQPLRLPWGRASRPKAQG
jgi:uncharacterized protein